MALIIAELGSSPAPEWDFARWCEGARAAGADAVKVQLFKAEHFPEAERASKRPLEFPRERLREFVNAARAYGLVAGASVFDIEAARLVITQCDFVKLAAREQVGAMFFGNVLSLASTHDKPLYRSISDFNYFRKPNLSFNDSLTTLFALQSYPASMPASVLALMRAASFFKARRARWGWSSHTRGSLDCIIAARLGASVIEKHLCMGTSDIEAGHSLLPHQFSRMVERIRQ